MRTNIVLDDALISQALRNVHEITSPTDLSFCPSLALQQQSRSLLCSCCCALKTNKNPTPVDEVIPYAFLNLTGAASKKEVVNLALQELVNSCIKKKQNKQDFFEDYINNPIRMEDFTPLHRDDIYNQLSTCNPLL